MYTDNETNITSVHVLIACSLNRHSQLVYYKITPDTPAPSTDGSNGYTDTQNSFKGKLLINQIIYPLPSNIT